MKLSDKFRDSFLKNLNSLFKKTKNLQSEDELNALLVSDATSENEKDIITQIINDIEEYHSMMNEIMDSDKKPVEWFEDKLEEIAKDKNPEATDDDVTNFKNEVLEGIKQDADDEIELLEQGLEEINKNEGQLNEKEGEK